jgi:hypothetical protein
VPLVNGRPHYTHASGRVHLYVTVLGVWVVSDTFAPHRYDAGGCAEREPAGAVPVGAHSWNFNAEEIDFSDDAKGVELETRELRPPRTPPARGRRRRRRRLRCARRAHAT